MKKVLMIDVPEGLQKEIEKMLAIDDSFCATFEESSKAVSSMVISNEDSIDVCLINLSPKRTNSLSEASEYLCSIFSLVRDASEREIALAITCPNLNNTLSSLLYDLKETSKSEHVIVGGKIIVGDLPNLFNKVLGRVVSRKRKILSPAIENLDEGNVDKRFAVI